MRHFKVLFAVVLMNCLAIAGFAQVIIGTGTSNSQRNPFMYWYGYGRDASIYTAAEMGTTTAGQTITTLEWNSSIASSTVAPTVIYLKAVGATTAVSSSASWADNIAGATQVYSGTPANFVAGWNMIDITDFPIAAGQNLMVLVECNFGGSGTGGQTSTAFYYTAGPTDCHGYWQKDSSPPTGSPSSSTSGGVNTNRPNIKINATAATCTAPTVTFTIVPNCPSGQFSVNVNITNMGSATSIGISDGTNNYGPATATGTIVAGPYASASSKTITLTHNVNTLCSITSPVQTYTCPPTNDECATAIAFPSIPTNGDCANVVANTYGATQSLAGCAGTADDDVWYSFVCPAGITKLNFTNTDVSGNSDRVTEFFSGTCGSLTSILCSDPESGSITGLTPGATYYMRIYTYSSGVTSAVSVCLKADSMAYVSSTTTQPETSSLLPGDTKQNIIRMEVVASGSTGAIAVTQFDFNTTGTTNPVDIANAKVYSTGTSSTFSTDSLFGAPVLNPNGSFSVTGSKNLTGSLSGTTNYFFLTYDVSCAATPTNVLDAQCTGIKVANVVKTPTATNPSGTRTINTLTAPTFTYPSTGSTTVGTPNVEMGRVRVTGSNCVTTVTSVTFNTSSTPAADITQAKCYYVTSSSGTGTATPFGSPVLSPNGNIVFTGSQALASGNGNYFWLAYDVSCSAGTTAGVDSIVAVPVSVTTNVATVPLTTPGTVVKRRINAPTAPAYTATTSTTTTVGTPNLTLGRISITGDNCNSTVTSVKFNTASSPVADISQARCYYTTSTTFSTDSVFGSPVISPSGDITFNGSKTLATGSGNYFWLTYDISCTSGTTAGVDSVSATPVSITTNGGTISVATPSSNPKKKVNAAAAPTYTATTSTSTNPGVLNLTIGRTNITGDNCNTVVSSVKFNTSTSPAGDLSRARCYYTTGTTFNTDSVFGSPVVSPNGDIVFNGSKTLAIGSGNYFWLTYDINCAAGTVAGVDSVTATPVSITTNGNGAISVATPSSNAKKGVVAPTAFSTIADGDWSSPSTWLCGNMPTSTTNVTINNVITVTTGGNVAGNITIASGKSLTISGGSLTMGPLGGGNKILSVSGTLAITGGTLNTNGNVILGNGSTFNMSAGNFNIDPNDGTSAGSVASGTAIFSVGTAGSDVITTNITGGNILINDPAYAGTGYTVAMYTNTAQFWGAGNTTQFGGTTGTNITTSTVGFKVDCYINSARLSFGSIIINGNAADRYVNDGTYGISANGDLTINAGSELRIVSSAFSSFARNVTNNGTLTITGTFRLESPNVNASAALLPSTNAQIVSGTGVYRNATSSPTANFTSMTVNNTNAAGVTFADANSLLSGANTGTVSGTLTMIAGKINVGTNALVLGTSASSTGTYTYTAGMIVGSFKRWLDASTGSRAFDIGLGNVGRKVAINFTTAPTTGGSLTAKWNSAASGTNGLPLTEGGNTYTNTSANGYWTVSTGDGLTGGTYTVAMTLTGGSDAPDYSTVTIGKRNTSADPWALVGTAVASTGNANNFTVSRTGVTGFSDFTLLLTSTPLPIKLATFTGRTAGTANILNWTTANEKDASHFEIMRSNDGNKFDVLDKVNAKNNFAGSKYEFVDNNPFDGRNYYRLNMVDVNGKSIYSDVVVLSVKSSAGLSVTASPNPVNQSLSLIINGKISGKATIQIVDITGKIVRKMNAASNNIDIDMSNLANGTYIIRYDDDSNSSVIKVTKN